MNHFWSLGADLPASFWFKKVTCQVANMIETKWINEDVWPLWQGLVMNGTPLYAILDEPGLGIGGWIGEKNPVELTLGTSTDPKEWRGTESVLNSKRSTLADEVSADASLGILDFFDNTVHTNLQILQDLQVSCRTRASRECLPREDHARRTLMKCSADTVDTQVLLDPLTFCRLDTWLLCMHACNVM